MIGRVLRTTFIICALAMLCACKNKTEPAELNNGATANNIEPKETTEKPEISEKIDLGTKHGIRSYLEGDWSLLDRDTGEDYGTLSLRKDGSFEFTRLSDKAEGSGKISFEYNHSEKYHLNTTIRKRGMSLTGSVLIFTTVRSSFRKDTSCTVMKAQAECFT